MNRRRKATTELWGEVARQKASSDRWRLISWDAHPRIKRHIRERMTGDPEEDWLGFVKKKFAPAGLESGLSLGCGWGALERDALKLGLCNRFEAYDIAPGAIEIAKELAAQEGLQEKIWYHCADLNQIALPRAKFDIIFAAASLHHVERLEHLLDEIHSSLHPDGLFVMIEYVGPSRYQWSDLVEDLMNRLLDALPDQQKLAIESGHAKGEVKRPTVQDVIDADPSESVRSDEILDLVLERFDIAYQADFGGTLLQFVLADIVGNFHEDDPKDLAMLDLLYLYEQTLIDEDVITSDFTFLIGSRGERS